MMLLASSPSTSVQFGGFFGNLSGSEEVRTKLATSQGDLAKRKDPLLRTNQAADFVLGQSPLLRSNLAAYFDRHPQLEAPHTGTYEAQFASADEAQNLNATAIEAVCNDGRRSLLEARIEETTARQCSSSYVEGSHVKSAKIAGLCKWRDA